jgi:predicted alpha/beta-hydrolase family hydrolase
VESATNYSIKALKIAGYRGELVPNTFFHQNGEADHLAILFPGIGYTCQMPLLYYQTKLFLSLGADVLWVEYGYNRADFKSMPDSEQKKWFNADVTASCKTGLEQRAYSKVTLGGKSLGTVALGHLLTSELALSHAQAIWLTPLLKDEKLRGEIRKARQRSLLVIGTKDAHYDAARLEELKTLPHVRTVVLEGADHSLEVEGDVSNSIRLIDQVIQEIKRFVEPGGH